MVARICDPDRWTITTPSKILVNVDTKPTSQQLGVRRCDQEEVINAALREVSIEADRQVTGWSGTLPANNILQNICMGGRSRQDSTQLRTDAIVSGLGIQRVGTELGYVETRVVQRGKMAYSRDAHLLAQRLPPLLRVIDHWPIESTPNEIVQTRHTSCHHGTTTLFEANDGVARPNSTNELISVAVAKFLMKNFQLLVHVPS